MKIIITGGAGFIGSAVIRHIINETQDQALILDNLTYAGNLESLDTVAKSERYKFRHVDIRNRAELDRVFAEYQPDAVMHLTSENHVDRSIDAPDAFIETNIVLLEASRKYWQTLNETSRNAFRFHHISTDDVYGELYGTDDLFTETTPCSPSSPYSVSKTSSDHLVRAWLRTYGMPTIVTNCSNNYGPCHFSEKLIPFTILNTLGGKALPVYDTGDQDRDRLYVEDYAMALYQVVCKGQFGEIYNRCGYNARRNIEVVQTICHVLDKLVPIKPHNLAKCENVITFVTDRPGHDMRDAIDASKIELKLGWKLQEIFESGIKKTVEWYLVNQAWWSRVKNSLYVGERLGLTR